MSLETAPNGLHIKLQQVNHASRVHLDIETGNIETEVNLLKKLSATRVMTRGSMCLGKFAFTATILDSVMVMIFGIYLVEFYKRQT